MTSFSSVIFHFLALCFSIMSPMYLIRIGTIVRLPTLLRVRLFKFPAKIEMFCNFSVHAGSKQSLLCYTRLDSVGLELFLGMFDMGDIFQAISLYILDHSLITLALGHYLPTLGLAFLCVITGKYGPRMSPLLPFWIVFYLGRYSLIPFPFALCFSKTITPQFGSLIE